ncbi:hypothetical protein CsSME_00036764 [Camellia sinensis var. sinensis]
MDAVNFFLKVCERNSQDDIRMSRVSAEILGKFIHAAHINARNPMVLVCITTSWALTNICLSPSLFEGGVASHLIVLLIECSLQLTKDSGKKGELRSVDAKNYQTTSD